MLPPETERHPNCSPPPFSSLDPHETKPHHDADARCEGVRSSTELDLLFRHSGWRMTRQRVFDALGHTAAGVQRLQRFAMCGSACWIHRTTTHPRKYRLSANYCRDRFCTPCCRATAQVIGMNLEEYSKGKSIRFLTLTKKTTDDDLDAAIDSLYAAFRRLRNRKTWRERVTGGTAFLEVKWNESPGRWHAHLHILIEGRYWDQREIAAEWLACTGDSHIVDIRSVPSGKPIVNYLVKYATKSIDTATTHNPPRLRQAIVALHGRRSCTTFGTWRGLRLHHSELDGDWEIVMPLSDCIRQKEAGNGLASIILEALRRNKPWTMSLHERSPPLPPCAGGALSHCQPSPAAPSAECTSTSKGAISHTPSSAACVSNASAPLSGLLFAVSSAAKTFLDNGG